MDDPAFHGAAELVEAIRIRKLSSRELVDHYLARIEKINPALNAVVTLDIEAARQRADAADRALARGESWGPLHGLPITVKDVFETAGLRTTAGAPMFSDYVPTTDAIAVARLKAAGAVLIGKTNTPIFAGDGQTYNAIFGTTNNPWDLARSPGGSSGGSAAAIAAGLSALELGSDIGGSIRSPAHCCGVYGLKPTYGIVPLRGHVPPMPGTLADIDIAMVGPLARHADDLDLALSVLAGPLEESRIAWRLDLPAPRRKALREYRVAAWLDDALFPVDDAVRSRLEAAVDALRHAGVNVDDRARPAISFAKVDIIYNRLVLPLLAGGLPPETFSAMAKLADSAPADSIDPAVFEARAYTLRHRDWIGVNEQREQLRARWAAFFRNYDVMLCPAMSVAAIRHDHSEPIANRTLPVNGIQRSYWSAILPWSRLAGTAYLPAAVAPVGTTPEGLPVGIQIIAPYLEDRTAIDFARRLAEVIGGYERPPGY